MILALVPDFAILSLHSQVGNAFLIFGFPVPRL
jgi:hypothetical protein